MRRTFLLSPVVTMAVVLVVWLASASSPTRVPLRVQRLRPPRPHRPVRTPARTPVALGLSTCLVRGKHVCRAAPDLRVAVAATPSANRSVAPSRSP